MASTTHARSEEAEESGSDQELENVPPQGRNVFEDEDGRPIRFFLHKSVNHGRDRLTQLIEEHGGEVLQIDEGVDTVLIGPNCPIPIERMRLQYSASMNMAKRQAYIEPVTFVRMCIRHNAFFHIVPKQQGMGGRIGDRTRVNFTQEDDYHLAFFLATVIPDKSRGGRTGNSVYKQLVELADGDETGEYAWTKRHTWHSWRERYKMNQASMDEMIDTFASTLPTMEKALYPLNRLQWRGSQKKAHHDDEDNEVIDIFNDSEHEEVKQEENNQSAQMQNVRAAGKLQRNRNEPVAMPQKRPLVQQASDHPPRPQPQQKRLRKTGEDENNAGAQKLDKGKNKASKISVELLKDDGLVPLFSVDMNEDLFGPDEPGPSGTQYSAGDEHQMEEPEDQIPPSSSPNPIPAGFASSQATLIATQRAQTRVAKRGIAAQPVDNVDLQIPPRAEPTRAPQQEVAVDKPSKVPNKPVSRNLRQRKRNVAGEPPQPIEEPTAPAARGRDRPAARKVAQRERTASAEPVGPYRNTRSRSRSVQPEAIPSLPAGRRRGRPPAKRPLPAADEDEEAQADGEDDNMVDLNAPEAQLGTIEEEQIVEEQLFSDDLSPAPPVTQFEEDDLDEQPVSDNERQNDPTVVGEFESDGSLATDDSQTFNTLRPFERGSSSENDELSDSDAVVNQMRAAVQRPITNRVNPSIPRSTAPGPTPGGLVRVSAAARRARGSALKTPVMRTRGARRNVTSSSEELSVFPSSGTRARNVKDALTVQEKNTPYTPPRGTKAALLVA